MPATSKPSRTQRIALTGVIGCVLFAVALLGLIGFATYQDNAAIVDSLCGPLSWALAGTGFGGGIGAAAMGARHFGRGMKGGE